MVQLQLFDPMKDPAMRHNMYAAHLADRRWSRKHDGWDYWQWVDCRFVQRFGFECPRLHARVPETLADDWVWSPSSTVRSSECLTH